jgi:hypothetical protein
MCGNGALRAVRVVWWATRILLFYPLMWLRLPVYFLTTFCAWMGMLGLVLAAALKPDWHLLWKLGTFSFGAFLIGWLYDGLLLLLSPSPLILDERYS